MQIRNFVETDRDVYMEMAADFYDGDSTLFPIAQKNLQDTFQAILNDEPSVRGVILEQDGQPAGYALLVRYWSCEAGGEVILLDEVYVSPAFRGHGLGSQFMEWMLREYAHAKRFRLEICPKNPRVRALYARYGFQPLDYMQMIR